MSARELEILELCARVRYQQSPVLRLFRANALPERANWSSWRTAFSSVVNAPSGLLLDKLRLCRNPDLKDCC